MTAWWELAACRNPDADPRDFDADATPDGIGRARLICRHCPVALDCGLDAIAASADGVIRAEYIWAKGKPRKIKKCRNCGRWGSRTHCCPACATAAWSARRCTFCRQYLTHRRIHRYCDAQCAELGRRARAGLVNHPEGVTV